MRLPKTVVRRCYSQRIIHLGVFASVLSASLAIEAQSNISYLCTLSGDTRVIAIEYSTTEPSPCTVTYQKNDHKQTLWQATEVHGYCEHKAQAFLDKQRSWGWQCRSENIIAAQ